MLCDCCRNSFISIAYPNCINDSVAFLGVVMCVVVYVIMCVMLCTPSCTASHGITLIVLFFSQTYADLMHWFLQVWTQFAT